MRINCYLPVMPATDERIREDLCTSRTSPHHRGCLVHSWGGVLAVVTPEC